MQEEKFYSFVRELVKHDPVLAESIINGHMALLEYNGFMSKMAPIAAMTGALLTANPANAGVFSDSPQDKVEHVVEKYHLVKDASSITDGIQLSKEIGKYLKAIAELENESGDKGGAEPFSSEDAQLMLKQYANFYRTIQPELRVAAKSAQSNFQKTFDIIGLNDALQTAML